MTVPWSRAVTMQPRPLVPLVAAGSVLVAAVLLAACDGGAALTAAGLPVDAPTGTPTGAVLPAGPQVSNASGRSGSAAGLLAASRAAFAAAPSVHVTGTLVRGAQGYELDLRLQGAAGGTARIVPSTSAPGPGPHPEVRVIRVGAVAWVGGNLGFWRGVTGDDARARRMLGSWVKVPADGGNFGEYVAFTQPATLAALLPDPAQPASLEPRVPFDGHPAVPVVVDRTTRLTVAAEGPAYPLQLSGLTSDETVSRFLNFSDYGAPVALQPPDAGTVQPTSGAGS